MVAYATVAELAQVATDGWRELSQLVSGDPALTGDLLQQKYNGESLDDPALSAAADTTLTQLEDALESVSRYADSYLNQRYRELVPLAAEHYENTGLPFAVAALTLGRLYGLDKSDDMRKALAEQEGYLKDLAAGRASLNYEQPSTPDEPGRMTVNSRPSAFNWDGY